MEPLQKKDFAEIAQIIEQAKQRAYQAVNTTLIELYWQVGAHISGKLATAEWGDGVITQLAQHLAVTQPNLKGFTRPNLFRMKQFYETYQDNPIVSPLVRQLSLSSKLSAVLRESSTSLIVSPLVSQCTFAPMPTIPVIPAQAGIHSPLPSPPHWIPAYAGMTAVSVGMTMVGVGMTAVSSL